MKVLMTGHQGYIGSVMAPFFRAAGHSVTGLDIGLFQGCFCGDPPAEFPTLRIDLRDITPHSLVGFDAVVHLAALSNDPLGNVNTQVTYDINHLASVRLAEAAKAAGIPRYLYASSCSLYGVAGDDLVAENAEFHPVTAYGESKVRAERDISRLADDKFSPVFLRNATAYGFSPSLRVDIVVNSLVGYALTTGEVFIQSDGTPWRPLVHIEDISQAFLLALTAPREKIHNEAFNVGSSLENYRIRDVAEIVRNVVPGCQIRYATDGGPDARCYRVDCSKIARVFPDFRLQWNVEKGARQLYDAYQKFGLTKDEFLGSKFLRIKRVKELQGAGRLDDSLRWLTSLDTVQMPLEMGSCITSLS
jgi:nucleoside-diphosphate-sugar epimerase